MPKACVTKNLKTMGLSGAVKKCYPKATKAVIETIKASFPGPTVDRIVRGVKRHKVLKEVNKSKPKSLSIRKDVPEMEKRRRKNKVKSMNTKSKVYPTKKKPKKKYGRGDKLGRDL